jgi:hypothetical protein
MAGMAVASTIAIGISAQRISAAWLDVAWLDVAWLDVAWLEVDVGGQSWSDLRNITMEAIIAANIATPIAAHSQTVMSTPFTGRTPPSG